MMIENAAIPANVSVALVFSFALRSAQDRRLLAGKKSAPFQLDEDFGKVLRWLIATDQHEAIQFVADYLGALNKDDALIGQPGVTLLEVIDDIARFEDISPAFLEKLRLEISALLA